MKPTVLVMSALLASQPACGTSAVIWLEDGRDLTGKAADPGRRGEIGYEVEIKRSSPEWLTVASGQGGEIDLPCNRIADISHPGRALLIA
jgi:hypothetical protein